MSSSLYSWQKLSEDVEWAGMGKDEDVEWAGVGKGEPRLITQSWTLRSWVERAWQSVGDGCDGSGDEESW